MCGFAGFLDRTKSGVAFEESLQKMGNALRHRGPDDSGHFALYEEGLGLVHQRLSIIDLSLMGRQPMKSGCGRYLTTYNGEIYNYVELRQQLIRKGFQFESKTDTEVLLNSITCWGLEQALEKLKGMFALALVDLQEKYLHLIRDRIGEKPLYYGWQNNVFLFGSELKALRVHPAWVGGVDPCSASEMLQLGYVPYGRSIHPDIKKVRAGEIVTLPFGPTDIKRECSKLWWSYSDIFGTKPSWLKNNDAPLENLIEDTLREVVSDQKIADVPVGAFLSGGIDSSLVVSILQEVSSRPVQTFSIGSADPDYDESHIAEQVARQIGTEHSNLVVTPEDAMEIIPGLSQIYDEPFADSSQIPTLLVARMARGSVKVALTGDGGDEMFAGYNRYRWAPLIAAGSRGMPVKVKAQVVKNIEKLIRSQSRGESSIGNELVESAMQFPQLYSKLAKAARILSLQGQQEIYESLTREPLAKQVLLNGSNSMDQESVTYAWQADRSFSENMMIADAIGYLPDDILVKVDRASMSIGLEVRVPFVDYRVLRLAASIPMNQKIRYGKTKWPLRRLLSKKISPSLINRPKSGFSVPITEWLRGPLRPWVEDCLSSNSLTTGRLLDPKKIRSLWHNHLIGVEDNSKLLWHILMYQSWFDRYGR